MTESPAPVIEPDAYKVTGAPVLLLAGPGTGKTYQLAMRIKFLVDEQNVSPDEITVITFTREAAAGMREKLKDQDKPEYIEVGKRPKNILTMHSLGMTIVNEKAGDLGMEFPIAVVTDSDLRKALMRDAALLNGLTEADAQAALNDKQTANEACSEESKTILNTYNSILRACNALDFDDQISLACDLLEQDQSLLDQYRSETRHLLVDEYQDINADQDRLIHLLVGGQEDGLFAALCVNLQ
jgi:ATP-dependent DNA helicase Rep